MPRLPDHEDSTLLSFLDTLSNGVGAAILLLLVFGSSALSSGRGSEKRVPGLVSVRFTTEDDAAVYMLRAERSPSVTGAAFVPLHHVLNGQVLLAPSRDPSSGITLWTRADPRDENARSTQLLTRVERGQCLGLTLGYQDRISFDSVGRLDPLLVELRWGEGERCCLRAYPDFTGGELWIGASAHATVRCPGKPRPDCSCGGG